MNSKLRIPLCWKETVGPDGHPRLLLDSAMPVDERGGILTMVRWAPPQSFVVYVDLASGEMTESAPVDGLIVDWAVTPTAFYFFIDDESGGSIVRLARGERWLYGFGATGIRHFRGIAAVGDFVYWVDDNYFGMPAQVFGAQVMAASMVESRIELIAEVEGMFLNHLAAVGGSLYTIGESRWLVEIEPDTREVTVSDLHGLAVSALVADGDQLLLRDGYTRLFAQPL